MNRYEGIKANRGSDVTFSFIWPDIEGNPLDLTGWTLGLFEASSELDELVEVSSDAPEDGIVLVRIEWDDALLPKNNYALRIKATSGSDQITTNLIQVAYS
jgi:hypothetical protein